MLALSYWQPWASLIVLGMKEYETRGWRPNKRGVHAVHAARKVIPFDAAFGDLPPTIQKQILWEIEKAYGSYKDLPTGAIVGTAQITDIWETRKIRDKITPLERALGNYSDGRFAWQMMFPKAFDRAIQERGHQGFWYLDSRELEGINMSMYGRR